jgi:hypothetical protein
MLTRIRIGATVSFVEEMHMTYAELATIKTQSMEVNLIIDDVVGNARWGCTRAQFKKEEVSAYDAKAIYMAIQRYGAAVPSELVALMGWADELAFEQMFMIA